MSRTCATEDHSLLPSFPSVSLCVDGVETTRQPKITRQNTDVKPDKTGLIQVTKLRTGNKDQGLNKKGAPRRFGGESEDSQMYTNGVGPQSLTEVIEGQKGPRNTEEIGLGLGSQKTGRNNLRR